MGYLFVGEKPSARAYRNGWTWADGRLGAKNLFDALAWAGIERERCGFVNLFGDTPDAPAVAIMDRVAVLRATAVAGTTLVALGARVSKALTAAGVPHRQLRHPAARGAGRKTETYRAHVESVLCLKASQPQS